MPIGDYVSKISSSRINRMITKFTGTTDLHAHMRIKPVVKYFSDQPTSHEELKLVEIGCGSGSNLFEISKVAEVTGVGYDLNCSSIDLANKISKKLFNGRFKFLCEAASSMTIDGNYDYVLFIDFLEHVEEPEKIIEALDQSLNIGGKIVVSVPTLLYPIVFGERFHKKLGHVMNGYTLEHLRSHFPSNYELVTSSYNTGWPAAIGCFLYYRFVSLIGRTAIRVPFEIILQPFRWLDWLNGPASSSSLFAVFKKIS